MRIIPLGPPYEPRIASFLKSRMPEGWEPLVLYRALATNTFAWDRFFGGSMLESDLPVRYREIVILRTCALASCEYEWGVHVAIFAEAAGLSRIEVAATLSGAIVGWTPDEAALMKVTEALHHRSTLSPEEYRELERHFSQSAILEVLLTAGRYRMISYLANSLDLCLETKAARFADYEVSPD